MRALLAMLPALLLAGACKERPAPSAWSQTFLAPDRVVAHRIQGDEFHWRNTPVEMRGRPRDAADGGPPLVVVAGWVSVEHKTLAPGSPVAQRLSALLQSEAISIRPQPRGELAPCLFNGDFGLQWIRGGETREVVFCFSCGQSKGTAEVTGYDSVKLGRLAHELFPEEESFARVARGEPPH